MNRMLGLFRSALARVCDVRCCAVVALAASCGAGGCAYLFPDVPLSYQRQQIQRFDPFPDQDIAPPMVGVRPPDFNAPLPEGERAFLGLKRPSAPWRP